MATHDAPLPVHDGDGAISGASESWLTPLARGPRRIARALHGAEWIKPWLGRASVGLAVAGVYLSGAMAPFDATLLELQYRLLERKATGSLVVVDIDARSLQQLATWPWPRAYHATIVDRLVAAGARTVAFDVDFSSRSTAEGDTLLAEALDRASGRVILPVFKQRKTATDGGNAFVYSAPIPELQGRARLAAINVKPKSDGRIWSDLATDLWKGWRIPTMAGLLADQGEGRRDAFLIDYGIRPATLPLLSFVDVMNGQFDKTIVAGKAVIIGSTAAELGDYYPVPVYAALPAVLIQGLAYESLRQGTAARPAPRASTLLLALALAIGAGGWLRRLSWRAGAGAAVALSGATIGGAFAVRSYSGINLEVATPILGIIVVYVLGVLRTLDMQAARILREHIEAAYRRAMMKCVVDDSSNGIVITDHAGIIRVLNPAAASMFGCDAETSVNRPLGSIVELPRSEAWQARDPNDGDPDPLYVETVSPFETSLRAPNAEPREVEITAHRSVLRPTRHPFERRKIPRTVYIYTIRDITARKRAEEAERRAKEEAIAANRAKTEFLGNVSHELRTPLNAVIGFSDMMRLKLLGPLGHEGYREYANDIHRAGAHLLDVINDILDVSRIEMGKLDLRNGAVDVRAAVDLAVRLVRPRAQEKRISVETAIDSGLPSLWADERGLKQMLLNVLSNAIKFTPSGGQVSVVARVRASGEIAIEVVDTGIGIAKDVLPAVTKQFYQADSSDTRRYEGTGLGLSIVQGLIKLHGGKLAIASQLGVGTTVTLTFPRERVGCVAPDQGPGFEPAAPVEP